MQRATKNSGNTGNLPDQHPAVSFGKTGVLLVNLGTPDGYDRKSMYRYLREFLTDSRVIEWPKLLWYPILFGIVLNVRPKKSGAAYKTIWNHDANESPLRTFTRSQAEQLATAFSRNTDIIVDWAMRYGQPSISSRLEKLQANGCERIIIFPLYPQYSASTTATVNDKVFEYLMKQRWMPALRTIPSYHDDTAYIEALCSTLENALSSMDHKPEKIIASYHGIPKSYFEKGDPYHCHCMKTTRLVRERMGFSQDYLITCFQSRFGPEEWLQPYTDKTIEKLATEGVKNLAVFNPGFSSDCLETLEEIAVEGKDIFLEHGGDTFHYIPCLNDSPEGMHVIETVVRREMQGWVTPLA